MSNQVGVTRSQFYEWLNTCPAPHDTWFVGEDDEGYARVFFSFDEEDDDNGED